MKALPVRLIYGQGYESCTVEEATHVTINIPGPSSRRTLPVIRNGTREGTNCWSWNGSTDAPTLRPSVLTEGQHDLTDEEHEALMAGGKIVSRPFVCHSWINDGQVQFLSDCTHEFVNQTVPLLDV